MNTRHITLGTFVLVTLGAFGWLAAQLGLGDRGGTHYTVRTPDAAGLVEGNSVRIAGVDVGKVERIRVEGNRAVIELRIRKGTPVFADACAAVHIKGMLGEKYLGIDQAAEGQPMAPGAEFTCVTRTVDFDNALNATRDMVYGADPLLPLVTRLAHRVDRMTAFLDEAPVATAPADPSAPTTAPTTAHRPESLDRLTRILDSTEALLHTSEGMLAENRADLRAIVTSARGHLEDPRLSRMIANGDKSLDLIARRLPGLMNDLDDITARLKKGLELLDDKHRARFDAMIADASVALDNLRIVSAEFKGLGDDLRPALTHVAPLLKNLRTIAERAATINETVIRQMLQMEGFRVRLFQGKEARQHMRDQRADPNPPAQP